MKHALVKIGNYDIPLIGIAEDETKETCDKCKKKFHIQDVEIVWDTILCDSCKKN